MPSTTVGYEKLFNPALQIRDEDEFVQYILAEQPEAPKYFAVMKRVNKEGPDVIGERDQSQASPIEDLPGVLDEATVIDLSSASEFAASHVPGSINIPAAMLAGWAGWLVDYTKPVYLIAKPDQYPEATRVLRKIGLDDVRGYFDTDQAREYKLATESYVSALPEQLKSRIESGEVSLVDVRSEGEWKEGHIAGAEHRFLGRLLDDMVSIKHDKPIVLQCQSGGRSAIAASLLQAAGRDVINMVGGYGAWLKAGLPFEQTEPEAACEAGSRCSI